MIESIPATASPHPRAGLLCDLLEQGKIVFFPESPVAFPAEAPCETTYSSALALAYISWPEGTPVNALSLSSGEKAG